MLIIAYHFSVKKSFGMSGQNFRMNGHFVVFYPTSSRTLPSQISICRSHCAATSLSCVMITIVVPFRFNSFNNCMQHICFPVFFGKPASLLHLRMKDIHYSKEDSKCIPPRVTRSGRNTIFSAILRNILSSFPFASSPSYILTILNNHLFVRHLV